MSPDTIFAAQMWTWPDAVIKRDAQGRVVLVNATFLAMYGGTIEDWSGNLVTGWSNPPAPNTAVRFETRVASSADAYGQPMGELVFDWIESAGPDGTSLSIARNITHVMPGPGVTETPADTAPQAQAVQAAQPAFEAVPASAPEPVFEPVMQQAAQQHQAAAQSSDPASHQPPHQAHAPETHPPFAEPPVAMPPVQEVPQEAPIQQASVQQAPEPVSAASVHVAAEAPAVEPFAAEASVQHSEVAAVAHASVAHAPVAQAPVAQVEEPASQPQPDVQHQSQPADDTREFERRALPIEDESAVLGNNWRDAVIAKAVGAAGAQPSDMIAPVAPEAAPSATPEAQPTRILLAEDNAINALLTRTLLEAEGCIVDTVEDGSLAVEAMKVKTYDLVFMDMRMPNMDGLEATRKIRNMDHPSKGLPIIALTANAFDDDRNACFDSGMNDFMTKPVSAEELSEMVAAWTGEEAKDKLARMA